MCHTLYIIFRFKPYTFLNLIILIKEIWHFFNLLIKFHFACTVTHVNGTFGIVQRPSNWLLQTGLKLFQIRWRRIIKFQKYYITVLYTIYMQYDFAEYPTGGCGHRDLR
jgi:hypothetical protein